MDNTALNPKVENTNTTVASSTPVSAIPESQKDSVVSSPLQTEDEFTGFNNPQYESAPPAPAESLVANTTSKIEDVVSVAPSQSGSKRKLPKMVLIIIAVLLILSASGYAIWKYLLSGNLLSGNGGEITWWGLWEDESTVLPLIEEYQAKNPKVTIKYVKQSKEDYRDRVSNLLAKGEGPDIFTIHNSWVPMFSGKLDTLPSSVMTQEEYSKIFYPVIVSDMTTSQGIVGIPLGYDALTLYVNDDMFSAMGGNNPVTWDDFRSLALSLTARDETKNIVVSGVAMGNTANTDHWQEIVGLMMLQNGVNLRKPTENVKLASDALAFYTLFADKDKIYNDRLPNSTRVFAEGKAALYFGPSWRAFEIQQINPNLRFHTIPVPQLPKANPDDPDLTYATYWSMSVSQKSLNKKTAWDFLKFMSEKESLQKMYSNASKTRAFGEPYPRVDMADLLKDHPILGSLVTLAPKAKSWFLVSSTFDGPTGMNTQISDYYLDVVNLAKGSGVGKEKLTVVEKGVAQVISSNTQTK